MSTCSFTRLLKFDLGSNLFVLVSEFNNYVSIGFRTCLTYTTNQNEARLYPTKEGINLIHPQYRTLVGLKEKLSKGLQKRESLMESLVDTIFHIFRSSKQISLNPYQDPFTQSSQVPPSSPL